MSKYIITKKNFVKDYCGPKIVRSIFLYILFEIILISLLFGMITLCIEYDLFDFKMILMFIFTVLAIYAVTAVCCKSLIEYITIKRKAYTVVTATLIDVKEKHVKLPPFHIIILLFNLASEKEERPYTLVFEKYGKYYIPAKNYASNPYTLMTENQVFNSSFVKDTFILVVNKKNKILLAYNTKLFEYQE